MKEGEQHFNIPKKTKAIKAARVAAAFLAAAPAAGFISETNAHDSVNPRTAHEFKTSSETVNKSYMELLLFKLGDKYDYESENAFLDKVEKIFAVFTKDEKFIFARRIAMEFPNTKTGERIAQVLLKKY